MSLLLAWHAFGSARRAQLAAGLVGVALGTHESAPASSGRAVESAPPPGLVRIAGGATSLGSTVEFAKAEGLKNELNFPNVVCETPRHARTLDDFFVMVTEVTNEQYEAFVRATGHRPPSSWGARALDAARDAHAIEQAHARATGRPETESPEFDRGAWWARNWRTAAWEVRPDDATRPVVFVDYADVSAYARWAGLRPMTEFEFQRAGRGKSNDQYAWGDDVDATRAATVELVVDGKKVQPDQPFPAASFPRGATAQGVYDLCGNVWEWTSSSFTPYPAYRDLQIEVGAGKQRRRVDGLPAWSAERRVVVGGCFYNDLFTARLSTRRPADVAQTTDSLGFRCAASVAPGLDIARAVLNLDWPDAKRPKGVRLDTGKLLAAEHWRSTPGSARAKRSKDDSSKAADAPLAGYAVITGYDHIVYVPAVELELVSTQALVELSQRTGVVYLGWLSTSKAVLEPPLRAGSYLVGFLAASSPPASASSDGSFDPTVDNLVFIDPSGARVASMAAPALTFMRPLEPSLTLATDTHAVTALAHRDLAPADERVTIAQLNVSSWVRISSRGFSFRLELVFARDDVTDEWRHP